MNREEKKALLRKAYRIDSLIRSHVAELEMLRSTLGSIGIKLDGGGRAPRWDGRTGEVEKIVRAVDLENKIKGELAEMNRRWTVIHEAIEAIEDADERLTLRLKYIEGRTWDDISVELHRSRTQVFRIYNRALLDFVPKI